MRGVRWARSSSRSSLVDSLPAPRASERCALGFTLIIDDTNAVMISVAESVPLRMSFPAWRPTNTGILMASPQKLRALWTAFVRHFVPPADQHRRPRKVSRWVRALRATRHHRPAIGPRGLES